MHVSLQGLSYSEDRDDYATNDTATAAASYAFLQHFFELFQSYAKLPFYIAGVAADTETSI